MKTAGIIGGMSWESTAKYYQWLNEGIRQKLGGLHSAQVVLTSVDFEQINNLQSSGRWDEAGDIMAAEARKLQAAGADFILLATNTMHKVADRIEHAVNIPFVHLADATAEKIKKSGLSFVGLLGTRYTMEMDFYKGRLAERGVKAIVPDAGDINTVHRVIFEELCLGQIKPASKEAFVHIARGMAAQGAQGVILGCTEISILLDQKDFDFPIFDTTKIHIEKALELMTA